jgi:hypothetical protein
MLFNGLTRFLRDQAAMIAAVIIGIVGLSSLTFHVLDKANSDDDAISTYEPPPDTFPQPSQTAINNNRIMEMGLVGDLDGLAVAYTSEADGLVGLDGRFRTELGPKELAAILRLDVEILSRSDAILFKVQSGRLTDTAKRISIRVRTEREQQDKPRDFVCAAWITKDYAFTLERLKHPSEDERVVLEAISKAARAIMPQPGDKVRAVSAGAGQFECGGVVVAAGMLPLEAAP